MSQDEEGRPASGVSRRTLIKRGAIVGGLVWVTPVVQSLRIPANAAGVGSGLCDACLAATSGTVTTHQVYNASTACCDCIAANAAAGPIGSVAICAFVTGACQPFGPVLPGPC